MNLSLIMPVHNEATYLPYALQALVETQDQFSEHIVVLDHCTDASDTLIRHAPWTPRILTLPNHMWHNTAAEAFHYGFTHATGDVLLAWAADLVMTPYFPCTVYTDFMTKHIDACSYRYINYVLHNPWLHLRGAWENTYKSMMHHLRPQARHSGVYAVRKTAYDAVGGLRDVYSEYDDLVSRLTPIHYNPLTYHNRIFHLRPSVSATKQYRQGRYRASTSLVTTLAHSIVHLKPYVFVGAMHERHILSTQK